MIYKDFDSYKINENVMNSTDFGSIQLNDEEECEYPIFEHFDKYSFLIELKSGRIYLYKKNIKRSKFWDLKEFMKDSDYSPSDVENITSSNNGEYIIDQYKYLSGLDISNVYQVKNKKK